MTTIPARDSDGLSTRTKLAYGIGDVGGAIYAGVYLFFIYAFLLEVAGLRPALVGLIFLISQIWDAITDPIVGTLVDKTRSRWGQKRPWLLFGAVPFGLAFFLHWVVPPFDQTGLFLYYLLVAILLRTAFTTVNIPYTALTPDLSQDYDERTTLNLFRFSFSILGSVTAVVLHDVFVSMGETVQSGHLISAAVWSLFIVMTTWIAFAGTYERPRLATPAGMQSGFLAGLRKVLSNKPFLFVTGIYLISWLSLQLVQTNLQLYAKYWADAESQFTLFVGILQLTAFLFLIVWSRISERIGKQRVYIAGAIIWILALLALYFVPAGGGNWLFGISFFAGVGLSVAYLIPWSMLPDVVEYDELQTGTRSEGVYYGMFVFMQKLGISVGLALSGAALDAAGFITPPTEAAVIVQPDAVLQLLRLIVSLIPVALLILTIPMAYYYPITRETFTEIKSKLARRRDADSPAVQ